MPQVSQPTKVIEARSQEKHQWSWLHWEVQQPKQGGHRSRNSSRRWQNIGTTGCTQSFGSSRPHKGKENCPKRSWSYSWHSPVWLKDCMFFRFLVMICCKISRSPSFWTWRTENSYRFDVFDKYECYLSLDRVKTSRSCFSRFSNIETLAWRGRYCPQCKVKRKLSYLTTIGAASSLSHRCPVI